MRCDNAGLGWDQSVGVWLSWDTGHDTIGVGLGEEGGEGVLGGRESGRRGASGRRLCGSWGGVGSGLSGSQSRKSEDSEVLHLECDCDYYEEMSCC